MYTQSFKITTSSAIQPLLSTPYKLTNVNRRLLDRLVSNDLLSTGVKSELHLKIDTTENILLQDRTFFWVKTWKMLLCLHSSIQKSDCENLNVVDVFDCCCMKNIEIQWSNLLIWSPNFVNHPMVFCWWHTC